MPTTQLIIDGEVIATFRELNLAEIGQFHTMSDEFLEKSPEMYATLAYTLLVHQSIIECNVVAGEKKTPIIPIMTRFDGTKYVGFSFDEFLDVMIYLTIHAKPFRKALTDKALEANPRIREIIEEGMKHESFRNHHRKTGGAE